MDIRPTIIMGNQAGDTCEIDLIELDNKPILEHVNSKLTLMPDETPTKVNFKGFDPIKPYRLLETPLPALIMLATLIERFGQIASDLYVDNHIDVVEDLLMNRNCLSWDSEEEFIYAMIEDGCLLGEEFPLDKVKYLDMKALTQEVMRDYIVYTASDNKIHIFYNN